MLNTKFHAVACVPYTPTQINISHKYATNACEHFAQLMAKVLTRISGIEIKNLVCRTLVVRIKVFEGMKMQTAKCHQLAVAQ